MKDHEGTPPRYGMDATDTRRGDDGVGAKVATTTTSRWRRDKDGEACMLGVLV